MRVQESMVNGWHSVQNAATTAAGWIGRTVKAGALRIADLATKVYEMVKPFFSKMKNFVMENQSHILIASVAVGGTALIALLFSKYFRNGSQAAPASSQAAPASSAPASSTAAPATP